MYFVVAMRVAEMGGWPVGWVPYLAKVGASDKETQRREQKKAVVGCSLLQRHC
jgi:hypothetical protein